MTDHELNTMVAQLMEGHFNDASPEVQSRVKMMVMAGIVRELRSVSDRIDSLSARVDAGALTVQDRQDIADLLSDQRAWRIVLQRLRAFVKALVLIAGAIIAVRTLGADFLKHLGGQK